MFSTLSAILMWSIVMIFDEVRIYKELSDGEKLLSEDNLYTFELFIRKGYVKNLNQFGMRYLMPLANEALLIREDLKLPNCTDTFLKTGNLPNDLQEYIHKKNQRLKELEEELKNLKNNKTD